MTKDEITQEFFKDLGEQYDYNLKYPKLEHKSYIPEYIIYNVENLIHFCNRFKSDFKYKEIWELYQGAQYNINKLHTLQARLRILSLNLIKNNNNNIPEIWHKKIKI